MNIVRRGFRAVRQRVAEAVLDAAIPLPGAGLRGPGTLASLAPTRYTPGSAMEFPAAANAIRLMATSIGQLDTLVEEVVGEGEDGLEWEPVSADDPERQVLVGSWEAQVGYDAGLRMLVQSMYLHGFAAAWVVRTGAQLRELVVLDPHKVQRVSGVLAGDRVVRITFAGGGGVPSTIPPDELIWLEYDEPLDRTRPPVSPFQQSWPALRAGIAAIRWKAYYFDRAATGGLYLTSRDESTRTSAQDVTKLVHAASDHRRMTGRSEMALPAGWGVQEVGANPEQAQLGERINEATDAIAQITNISPLLLQNLSRSTFTNYPQAVRSFKERALEPLASQISREISRVLWPSGLRRFRLRLELLDEEIRLLRARRIKTEVDAGVITANEGRVQLGHAESDDEIADRLIRSPILLPPDYAQPDTGLGQFGGQGGSSSGGEGDS